MTPPAAFGRWALDAEPAPTLLARSINEIWTARQAGQLVYLRVTPGHHRDPAQIAAELAFMDAAQAAGLRVVAPLPSRQGRLLETWEAAGVGPARVEAGSLACFRAAPGRHARKPDDLTPPVLQSWAALMADLHDFAQHHGQQPAFAARPRWQDDRVFVVARQASDQATRPAQLMLAQLETWMTALPTDADVFGFTHADLHFGNMSVDEAAGGQVTVFDFDDSCRHWFVHDLAVAITSIRKTGWEHPGRVDGAAAETTLLDAYLARRPLPAAWRARLEAFVAYRIALSACWASRSRELGELDLGLDAWFTRSLPWWLSQLEERWPAIDRALAA